MTFPCALWALCMLQGPTQWSSSSSRRALRELLMRVEQLLAVDSEELRGKAAVAVAKLGAEEKHTYQHMSDALLRAALKQLAQQPPAGGLCLSLWVTVEAIPEHPKPAHHAQTASCCNVQHSSYGPPVMCCDNVAPVQHVEDASPSLALMHTLCLILGTCWCARACCSPCSALSLRC